MNKKYFSLNDGIILVNGAKRGLIHNLNNKKLYSIDHDTKKYLNKLINGATISEALMGLDISSKNEFIEYLFLLERNNLGKFNEQKKSEKKIIKKEMNNIDTVWLELRRSCNLSCIHCYLDCTYNKDANLQKLTLNEWKSVIIELSRYDIKKIILIGGEPLMFCEINELITFIRHKFPCIQIVLYSNLTLLDSNTIDTLKVNNVIVNTSIYSDETEIHDKITTKPGSFNKTIDSIKRLKASNIYVKANIAVMKYNYADINRVISFVYNLTGVRPKCDIIRDVGESKSDLLVDIKDDSPNFKLISKEQFIRNISGNSCWQGKINITCDGYIGPCIMGNKFINYRYNVRDNSLEQILTEYIKKEFWDISKDKVEVCKDCEYRYACSDCRPTCESKYSKSSKCTYNPYLGEWDK